jgi:hypothetical protein
LSGPDPETALTPGSFFDEPISAALARRLGAFRITDTMERVPDIGFGSYDRLFPSQDFMPAGGFDSAIPVSSSTN